MLRDYQFSVYLASLNYEFGGVVPGHRASASSSTVIFGAFIWLSTQISYELRIQFIYLQN